MRVESFIWKYVYISDNSLRCERNIMSNFLLNAFYILRVIIINLCSLVQIFAGEPTKTIHAGSLQEMQKEEKKTKKNLKGRKKMQRRNEGDLEKYEYYGEIEETRYIESEEANKGMRI